MIRKTPDWPYWWAIADTPVELQHCVALSLNINPHAVPRGSHFIGSSALPWFVEDLNTVKLFWTRLRILHAHRMNGQCFSPVGAHTVMEAVQLREFAGWALRKFREPEIPHELAVLGRIGEGSLPEPDALEKLVAAWPSVSTPLIPSEETVSIGVTPTKSDQEKTSPSIGVARGIQRQRTSIEAQKTIILEAIASLHFDPMRFPKAHGVSGAKKAVFDACNGRLTKSQFNHRWQELRAERKIIDNCDQISN